MNKNTQIYKQIGVSKTMIPIKEFPYVADADFLKKLLYEARDSFNTHNTGLEEILNDEILNKLISQIYQNGCLIFNQIKDLDYSYSTFPFSFNYKGDYEIYGIFIIDNMHGVQYVQCALAVFAEQDDTADE